MSGERVQALLAHTLAEGVTLVVDLRSRGEGDKDRARARKLVKGLGFAWSPANVRWYIPETAFHELGDDLRAQLYSMVGVLQTLGVDTTVAFEGQLQTTQQVAATAPVAAPAATSAPIRTAPRPLDLTAVRVPWEAPGRHPHAWQGRRRHEVVGTDPGVIVARIQADIRQARTAGQLRLTERASTSVYREEITGGWALHVIVQDWLSPYKYSRPVELKGMGTTHYVTEAREALAVLRAITDQYNFNDSRPEVGYHSMAFWPVVRIDEDSSSRGILEPVCGAVEVPTLVELVVA